MKYIKLTHLQIASAITVSVLFSTVAAQTPGRSKEKDAAQVESTAQKRSKNGASSNEIKREARSFEVRGLNLGADNRLSLMEKKLLKEGDGKDVIGFPDTRVETGVDGGTLYFYRDTLFITSYDDIQDLVEVRAVMNKLEQKFGGKFKDFPDEKSQSGNLETTQVGFELKIGDYGLAKVILSSTRPIDRRACIDEIAREMRQRLARGLKNYKSLTDRVENECKEETHPTKLQFIHLPTEKVVNALATAERLMKNNREEQEKLNAAREKADKF